jgi:hypothetical protein
LSLNASSSVLNIGGTKQICGFRYMFYTRIAFPTLFTILFSYYTVDGMAKR